jgi:hypothetical protein
MKSAEKLSERNARYERWKVSVVSISGSYAYGDVLAEALNVFTQEFFCEIRYFRVRFKWQNRHSICLFGYACSECD